MTIFRKILNKEIAAQIVHEDEFCTAFHDISAQAPTHILVIPNKEIASLAEASTDDKLLLGHMLFTVAQIAKQLKISDDGYRVVINTNPQGGQTVYHLHMHILGGRPLQWPPG